MTRSCPEAPGPTDDTSDAVLLERCRARDESAIRTLTQRYNQRLFRVARGIVRDDAEAEDVVQETWVRACLGLDQFRQDAALATWLTRIAINEALGRLRRRRPTTDVDHLPATRVGDHPERAMAQRQLQSLLERAIDELPDEFRLVFIARIVEGLSIEETSRLLDVRPETVKTRVHRARVRLRTTIARDVRGSVASAFSFDGARCARVTDAVVRRVC